MPRLKGEGRGKVRHGRGARIVAHRPGSVQLHPSPLPTVRRTPVAIASSLFRILTPGGFLAVAALWAGTAGPGARWLEQAGPGLPWAVFALSFLLAWRFQRSRVASALVLLGLWGSVLPGLVAPTMDGALALAGLVMAGWWIVLMAFRDRGLRSVWGGAQVLAPALLLPAVMGAQWAAPGVLSTLNSWPWGRLSEGGAALPRILAAFPPGLPLIPTLAFAIAALVGVVVAGRRRSAVERGLLWALVCGAAGMVAGPGSAGATFVFTAGALVLGISVVELSHSLAYRDELTGLPTRRALKEALRETGGAYALAMVDVDHFKRFNDRHGHDVGDQVLRMVASHLARCGGKARAFRYGGEEFTLLFAGMDRKEAQPHLEEVRKAIEAARFDVRGRARPRTPAKGRPQRGAAPGKAPARQRRGTSLSVTVSLGASDSTRAEGSDAVLKKADQALYRAKGKGRNQVALG